MTEQLDALRASLAPYPWAYTVVVACALVLLACGAISEFVSGFHAGITGS